MKKLLLIPALLAGSLALAGQKNYEISPMIGYNFPESNFGYKPNGKHYDYFHGGLEFQVNDVESVIKPEFSILYSPAVNYTSGQDTKVLRGAFNGVYNFSNQDTFTPFVKAGFGVEYIGNATPQNSSGLFFDAGLGAKINFTESLALKLEAIYLAKVAMHHGGLIDNNLIALVGLTYAFGEPAKKAPVEIAPEPTPVPAPVVAAAVVAPVVIDLDDDNDGVLNSKDACSNTIAGAKVDAKGCNVDNDNDGVLNSADICQDTIAGEEVNNDGCPKTFALQINFALDSAKITPSTVGELQKYVVFLTQHTNYSAKIVGYSDSLGNASYNKKLSQKRADAVVDYLVANGVNASQLSSLGEGEKNPIADNKTAEGRAKNRRIEADLTRN